MIYLLFTGQSILSLETMILASYIYVIILHVIAIFYPSYNFYPIQINKNV